MTAPAHPPTETLGPCPRCGGAFAPLTVGSVNIDRCAQCQGLWLDERELEKVLTTDHVDLTNTVKYLAMGHTPSERVPGRCPRCQGSLIPLTDLRANVLTDSCSVCYGVFLDADELKAYDHPTLTARVGGFLRGLLGKS